MKYLYSAFIIFFLILAGNTASAQAPDAFSYQAVIRDAEGNVLEYQSVSFRVTLIQVQTPIYTETHIATTNKFGLVTLKIGKGSPILYNFSDINWAGGSIKLQVELDPENGLNYSISSVTELLSVPYAIYAESSGSGGNSSYQTLSLTGSILTISNGNSITLPSGGSSLIGANTTNFIPKWNGSSMIKGNIFDNGYIGIGTNDPDNDLHVVGGFKLVDGNQAAGRVLTSDEDGNASWQVLDGGGGTGTNYLISSNNLTDLGNYAIARSNLGLAIGIDVQSYDHDLSIYAAITPSPNVQTLLESSNYESIKSHLSLGNVENTALSTWAGSSNISTVGNIWGSPGIIGSNTPSSSFFTSLSANGVITLKPAGSGGTAGQVLSTDGNGVVSWLTINSGTGNLLAANNLSDLTNAATARTNLGINTIWATPGAIGSTTPSSAVFTTLKVTSGTPAAGKVLTSDADGNASWQATAAPGSHYVGELYGGGIVFYVDHTGNNGLIVSLKDLDNNSGFQWSNLATTLIGSNAQSQYDGSSNSTAITGVSSSGAAEQCEVFVNGTYTDWYLPSNWELHELFNAARIISNILDNDADVTNTYGIRTSYVQVVEGKYWSSTEFDGSNAYALNFDTGRSFYYPKSTLCRVRAIRAF
ncbi:DUF1566 domain-containing protein [Bacteroidota bacterium]